MGQPAARQGDTTAHGGVITTGYPAVLIGGQPAARMGDMHTCPMATPGTPPVPHVGGPILGGSATVLIGNQPAARQGDTATCVGPPDTIAMGCPTVMIGG
ncbi:MAG: PAAR domain-containing protein [Anaerolineae bacterium]